MVQEFDKDSQERNLDQVQSANVKDLERKRELSFQLAFSPPVPLASMTYLQHRLDQVQWNLKIWVLWYIIIPILDDDHHCPDVGACHSKENEHCQP